MNKPGITIVCGLAIFAASLAWAHDGVKNPAVKKRMELMKSISASTKVLGDMAAGKAAFDGQAASRAIGGLTGDAARVTDLFEPQANDPASESKPGIWENWDDFTSKADKLFKVVLTSDVSSPEALQASMGKIGGACKACHSTYKE